MMFRHNGCAGDFNGFGEEQFWSSVNYVIYSKPVFGSHEYVIRNDISVKPSHFSERVSMEARHWQPQQRCRPAEPNL